MGDRVDMVRLEGQAGSTLLQPSGRPTTGWQNPGAMAPSITRSAQGEPSPELTRTYVRCQGLSAEFPRRPSGMAQHSPAHSRQNGAAVAKDDSRLLRHEVCGSSHGPLSRCSERIRLRFWAGTTHFSRREAFIAPRRTSRSRMRATTTTAARN